MASAFERVRRIFTAAVALPPAKRARYLQRACGHDAALREEVESLLRCADAPSALDRPALGSGFHVEKTLPPCVPRIEAPPDG